MRLDPVRECAYKAGIIARVVTARPDARGGFSIWSAPMSIRITIDDTAGEEIMETTEGRASAEADRDNLACELAMARAQRDALRETLVGMLADMVDEMCDEAAEEAEWAFYGEDD